MRRNHALTALIALTALALLALAGCSGRDVVLGDGRDAAPAPSDAGHAPRDAAREPPRDAATFRDASQPAADVPRFMEPAVLANISREDTTDDDPSVTADRLLLLFNSKRDGGMGREDIWQSARSSAGEPWPKASAVLELNSDARETGIALAADGLQLWFSSDRDGGQGGLDVYSTRRGSRAEPWGAAAPVAELNSAGDELVSAISGDGRSLLLARRADEDDDYDLYVATRDAAGAWSAPAAIAELNSGDEESDGFLLDDGLQLIFTQDEDLMLARRPSADAPFAPAQPLDSLNSSDDDRDAWASDDLSYMVFSSDRSGSYLLYEAFAR